MSQGFSKWSNNDNSNPNIRAVRFGYNKPILETELNEIQDLNFSSALHLNRVMFKPNTYSSTAGSTLKWEYATTEDTIVANLILTATSLDDVIALNFSGGVVYYLVPKQLGRQSLISIEAPLNAPKGYTLTLVCKASLKTLSPDFSDGDYDERASYAIDSRYPSLVSTKRVFVDSGFDGVHTEVFLEDFNTVYNRLSEQRIKSLVSPKEAYLILGSWVKHSDTQSINAFSDVGSIQKVVSTLEEPKYDFLSDCMNSYGTYSATSRSDLFNGLWELRLDFPIKSIKYGYYAVTYMGGHSSNKAIPINQPLRIPSYYLENLDEVRVELYDLRDLVDEENNWGNPTHPSQIENWSWEDLLNQKWFDGTKILDNTMIVPSMVLKPKRITRTALNDVEFGSLIVERTIE